MQTGVAAVAMALAGLWADQLAAACCAAVRAPAALAASVQDGLEAMRLLPTMSRQVGNAFRLYKRKKGEFF